MHVDWALVYRETYTDLVRFLHRKVWDADQAQDLAQETFARALGHDPENPRAFLFTIAANLARDEARAAVRRKKHLTLMAGGAAGAAEAGEEAEEAEGAERVERADAVRRALDQLNGRDREVLLLWDAGLDYTQIARQTGLKPGAIGTTLARARKRLVEAHDAASQLERKPQTKQG